MLPYKDDNRNIKSIPFITYLLLLVNIFVFLFFQDMGENSAILEKYAFVPSEIISGNDIIIPGFFGASPHPVYLTLISSMFIHGGWLHLLGNMWFLFLFGNNLEDGLGHFFYMVFYIICGVAASTFFIALSYLFDNNLMTYSLGASGAISGVIGGYILMFPKNKIYIFFLRLVFPINAYVWGLMWIVMQIIGSLSMLSQRTGSGGVAYAAHLGGFLFGCLIIMAVRIIKRKIRISPIQ